MNFRNIIWNLLGLGLPLLMAVFAIPVLLSNIGAERFGLLGLAWGLIGYASILDFGMSRALTHKLARNRNNPEETQANDIVKSAISLTFVISSVFMLAMVLLVVAGVEDLFSVAEVTSRELAISTLILALALPIQAVSMAFRGVNEAYLNFRGISLVRIFLGIANFGAPCALSFFTVQMHHLVLTLLVARLCALIAFRLLARLCLPPTPFGQRARISVNHVKSLLQFGGWVAASSVLVPILMTSDRFFIGALVSTSAVTNYVIPYEILTQGLIIVGAITTIAFPSIAQLSQHDPQQALALFLKWTKRVTLLILLIQIVVIAVLPGLLQLWVGGQLDPTAANVGRILAIGVCAYPIGTMCTSYLHAYGKTKEVALLQMFEVVPFLLLLGILVMNYGEVGAALAWSIRIVVDSAVLGLTVLRMHRTLPGPN